MRELARDGRLLAKFSLCRLCCSPTFVPLLVRTGETRQPSALVRLSSFNLASRYRISSPQFSHFLSSLDFFRLILGSFKTVHNVFALCQTADCRNAWLGVCRRGVRLSVCWGFLLSGFMFLKRTECAYRYEVSVKKKRSKGSSPHWCAELLFDSKLWAKGSFGFDDSLNGKELIQVRHLLPEQ